nr:ectonucleotide pyrophosphatase/phosphodiesterase family member 6-like [Penaeus vannamei]
MKHRPSALLALVWAGMWGLVFATPVNNAHGRNPASPPGSKLLYIMLDGFRWDYVDLQSAAVLPGFTKFLKEGVRARWTHPLFPSLSYPTWTSLVTGQYAENHGVVGNYFYDSATKEEFSLFDVDSTGKQKSATTHIPYIIPVCNTEHTDNTGHNFGPDSEEVLQAVRDLDDVLRMLMEELEKRGMTDHDIGPWLRSELREGLDDVLDPSFVENMLIRGADERSRELIHVSDEDIRCRDHSGITQAMSGFRTASGNGTACKLEIHYIAYSLQVYASLMKMTGVNVYKHNDIPEKYHFKNNKYVHEIVVSAEKGNFVMASHSDKQLPARSDFVYYGAHGYDPDVQDMKGIFFAKGPAFQKGKIIEPIHVVDVYQVLTHVLGLTPQPHNGTWNHVQDAFVQSTPATHDGHVHMNSSSHDHAATGVHNHTQMGDHDHTQMGAHDHGNMGAHNHDDMSAHDHPHVGTHDHDDYDYDHDEHMGDHGQMSDSGHMADHDHMSDDDHNMHKHDHSQEHSRSGSAAPSLVMATLSGILAVLLL